MNKNNLYDNLPYIIGSISLKSMLYEVSSYPSPGLVSPISNGAHNDMDYYTFIDSTSAINHYFIEAAKTSLEEDDYGKLFKKLRHIGIDAENEMFSATSGVNTQKGIIFLMLIGIGASVWTIKNNQPFEAIKENIKILVKEDLDMDFISIRESSDMTYGEKLYLKYGLKGVRGEVLEGMPSVMDYGMQLYEESSDLPQNERLIHTLIGIMSKSEDTTILHRHPIETLYRVQDIAGAAMAMGGMRTKTGREFVYSMDKEFSKLRISPGGSADLTAMTIFFHEIKKLI